MDHLDDIRGRIRAACERVGRDPDEVTLVGASKRQPLERLQALYGQGLRCFGENRVQEAEDKKPLLPDDVDWHLIGPLQSNKVRRAAELFSTVHSIDRWKIARRLDQSAADEGRTLDGFLQVNVGDEDSKHGFSRRELGEGDLLSRLLDLPALRLRGLMAIPPLETEADRARHWFRALRELRGHLRDRDPRLGTDLSMGMSGDFEIAVEEGATHVRLGSILFGPRP